MERARNVAQLIERQMKLWEVRQHLAKQGGLAARQALVHLSEGPWITVSREYGSGGTDLARILGERLGWQVFDHEIVSTIAEQTRTREQVLSGLDETAIGGFKDYIAHLLVPGSQSQGEFLREMSHVIWALAKQGKAILVGRGANWFLDPKYGLRVRAVAPSGVRALRISGREEITPADAEKRLREADAQKRAFIHTVYGHSIDDPLGYDLVLNLGLLDAETAAETVVTALRRKLGAES